MLQVLLSAFFTLLMMVGCSGPRYIDYFPYHDDGTPKPRVALMPVIDSSKSGLPWDLSEELTQAIYYQLMDNGELYVLTPEEIGPVWAKRNSIDYFGNDLCFVREYCNTDFIVALELVEHSTKPCDQALTPRYSECHSYNSMLTLRMRVRVIDVRRPEPRIALYEIVKSNFTVTPPFDNINYTENCWGQKSYPTTPCGTVHQRIVQALTGRLEGVIWSAR